MNVPFGPASVVGYILTALGALGTALAAAEGELSGHGKWLAILTAVTGVATNLGRQLQAPKTGVAHVLPPITAAPPAGQTAGKTVEGP